MREKSSAAQKSSSWRGRNSRCGTWSCLFDGEVVAYDEMGSPYSTGSGKDEKLRDAGRVRPARDSPGFHKIAAQFGVATGTVQRIAAG
jgi:hypothetical protein